MLLSIMAEQEITDVMYSTIFNIVYQQFLKSSERIIELFPNLWENIKDDNYIIRLKNGDPTLTQNELVSYACTMQFMINCVLANYYSPKV
jgi:hypothetical protein